MRQSNPIFSRLISMDTMQRLSRGFVFSIELSGVFFTISRLMQNQLAFF
jgi:hypothetical protein